MPSAPERLREAAAQHDARVAALPYARALADQQLLPERQWALMRALAIIHDELARLLPTTPSIDERRVRIQAVLVAHAIDRNTVDEAGIAALLFAQRARLDAEHAHAFLVALELSPVYRLAGLPPVAATPAAASPAARLDDAAVDAARVAFTSLELVIGAAGRRARGNEWLATELNIDAGMHSIPADLREIEAALAAGEETWRHFAYYAARYGGRGRRFTASDAAWLVTLARDDATRTSQQVHWLAALLASRGMPRLLMEVHLQHLAATLTARVPERAARYRALAAAAHELHEERTAVLAEPRARDLVARFSADLEREAQLSPVEAGTLIVAAVADEALNVPGAVKALVSWLCDPARFTTRWRDAAQRLVADARAAVLR